MDNLQALLEKSRAYDEGKADHYVTASDVVFDDECQLNIVEHGLFQSARVAFTLEDHALGQVCDKLGPPPRKYMRQCNKELRAHNLNHWVSSCERDWMVRTHDDKARAVVSGLYAPVENTFILDTLIEFLGGTDFPLVGNSTVTRDEMFVRVGLGNNVIDIPGGEDAYASGIYFGNSEIGTGSVKILPFVMRTSCTNSTIWAGSDHGIIQKHYGHSTRGLIKALIKDKLGTLLGASHELLERIVQAELETIPDPIAEIEKFLSTSGSDDIRDHILVGMGTNHSRAGVHHGLTYAANFIEDPKEAERMQMTAGAYLFGQYVKEDIDG
jgi:hypothetical protein